MAAKTTRKRQTIGEDPLDALIPVSGDSLQSKKKASGKAPEPSPRPSKQEKTSKVRATFHLPEDLLEEARNAVVHLSGPPERLTLATFAETALRRELERLQKKHNGGSSFPKRAGDLRGGRPIGS